MSVKGLLMSKPHLQRPQALEGESGIWPYGGISAPRRRGDWRRGLRECHASWAGCYCPVRTTAPERGARTAVPGYGKHKSRDAAARRACAAS